MNILYIILKHVIWRFQIYNLFREDKSNNVFREIRKCFRKTGNLIKFILCCSLSLCPSFCKISLACISWRYVSYIYQCCFWNIALSSYVSVFTVNNSSSSDSENSAMRLPFSVGILKFRSTKTRIFKNFNGKCEMHDRIFSITVWRYQGTHENIYKDTTFLVVNLFNFIHTFT